MPFDHAASFALKGIPGNIVQDVINISTDAAFVAVAIGYGFEENRARAAELTLDAGTVDFLPGQVRLGQVPAAALIEGFRLSPSFDRLIFADTPQAAGSTRVAPRERTFSDKRIPAAFANSIIERLKPPEDISFLFSILDSGTGRELQDEPIHNLASLGKSDGERPFRLLAQPLTFQPRSTIRLQIVERAEGVQGTLFIVLYGYKVFGKGAEGLAHASSLSNGVGHPSSGVVPFDYVSKFQLTGTPGNLIEDEVPINVEGGFVATSIGYGLAVESLDVNIVGNVFSGTGPGTTVLGALSFSNFPTDALQDGIRIRPDFIRLAFTNGGLLEPNFPINLLSRVFERLNRPDDVSFRYSIFDTGTGRELQNEPINNIAGLGIANGKRPFKRFARPMLFQPRSTIRLQVEEQFGRGTLFIVFQGYKLLNAATGSQAPTLPRRPRRR
ncbi:MAG TPA: hypothetical protein VKB46_20570 [Pyrinomonadaceae bacterium]|nr:hypothetical protein [Pyrinomonadaceae bacterium]